MRSFGVTHAYSRTAAAVTPRCSSCFQTHSLNTCNGAVFTLRQLSSGRQSPSKVSSITSANTVGGGGDDDETFMYRGCDRSVVAGRFLCVWREWRVLTVVSNSVWNSYKSSQIVLVVVCFWSSLTQYQMGRGFALKLTLKADGMYRQISSSLYLAF